MQLGSILTLDRVRVPMAASDKLAAITELIDLLASVGALVDREAALNAVLKRESERTTGIGYGLAIPHGKTTGCETLVMAAGKPAQPLDFQSYDGRPVTFIVLLLSPPTQTGSHMQALARISSLMNIEGFREAVARAPDSQALYSAIQHFEATF